MKGDKTEIVWQCVKASIKMVLLYGSYQQEGGWEDSKG